MDIKIRLSNKSPHGIVIELTQIAIEQQALVEELVARVKSLEAAAEAEIKRKRSALEN